MVKKQHVQATKRAAKQDRARLDDLKRRQRRAERRRTAITILAGLVVGALLTGTVVFLRWNSTRIGYVSSANKAAKSAGCTGVRIDGSYGRLHVTTAIRYVRTPPSSGHHNPDPLPEQPTFIARDVKVPLLTERAVHNLEHGFVIGWYDNALPAADVARLKTASAATTRFIAVPWTRSVFPGGRHFVLTAWQRTERCRSVSAAAITAFTAKYVNFTTAPEAGGIGGSALTSSPSPGASPSASARPSASASARPLASPSPSP